MTFSGRQYLESAHSAASTSPSTIVAYGFLFVLLVYYIIHHLDLPILPISELAWNALVYVTPARLVALLHPSSDLFSSEDNVKASIGHAKKSEAMRHILGLDGTGMSSNVQRARSLSGIGSIMKGRATDAPPGLGNWDNSCYQNSILQGLASLESLPSYLDQAISSKATNSTKAALRDLLSRLNDGSNAGMMFWTPAILKSMSSWQQQDAQEYFSKVLDEVEKETSRLVMGTLKDTGLASIADLEEELRPMDPEMMSTRRPTSIIRRSISVRVNALPNEVASIIARNPLEGLTAQRVGCLQCGYVEGLSLTPFTCLTVPLGRQVSYDIRSCLDEYTALEPIKGVECAKCTLLRTRQQVERLLDQFWEHESKDRAAQIPQSLKGTLEERLAAVNTALENEDFADNTLLKQCQIGPKSRVTTTKTRQAVIARAPRSLVIHVNRSVFDEFTGAQKKNFADVRFPRKLDLSSWTLGGAVASKNDRGAPEQWSVDPAESMLAPQACQVPLQFPRDYELRAVVTHYGRHENGHYISYRKFHSPESRMFDERSSSWWRLSDEEVSRVSEDFVLAQGGVFMLFYEQVEKLVPGMDAHESASGFDKQQSDPVTHSNEEPRVAEPGLEATEWPRTKGLEAHEDRAAPSIPSLAMVDHVKAASALEADIDKDNVPAELPSDGEATAKLMSEHKNAEPTPIISEHAPTSIPTVVEAQAPQKHDWPATGQQSLQISHELTETESSSTSETAASPAAPEEAPKEFRTKVTANMRTASPFTNHGGSRRGSGMGRVSSMVTAN